MKTPDTQRVTLRDKIERIIDTRKRLVPEIVDELRRALRELEGTANKLADRLESPIAAVLDEEAIARPLTCSSKRFNESYGRQRRARLLERISAYKAEKS
ncbi:hypothetical protein [Bradyrhizobium genomosp. III]|uniref:hypothetical protein n=1 Tax=Bradyrhizobium genomosp. III TaxID=2683271 RepID=UPI0012F48FD9|nr:hypothetical protein [Bradyrhizobium sp. CCBAU 15635]